MKERLSSKHSDNQFNLYLQYSVYDSLKSPRLSEKWHTKSGKRTRNLWNSLEERARGAGYPQILHKTAYGGSTSQKPPKTKRAMQPSGFRCQHVHARSTTVLVNIPLECFTSYHNEAGRSYLKSINNPILKCGWPGYIRARQGWTTTLLTREFIDSIVSHCDVFSWSGWESPT